MTNGVYLAVAWQLQEKLLPVGIMFLIIHVQFCYVSVTSFVCYVMQS
jgi:hypothetical protein